jgi:hypothetical protein
MAPKPRPTTLNIRITPQLRAALDDAVIESGRSLNGEIVERLMRSFDPPPFTPDIPALISAVHMMLKVIAETGEAMHQVLVDSVPSAPVRKKLDGVALKLSGINTAIAQVLDLLHPASAWNVKRREQAALEQAKATTWRVRGKEVAE